MKKRFDIKKEVRKIEKQIKKFYPKVNNIDVKVEKTEKNLYETLIKVHIPSKHNLIAYKKDEVLSNSIEKSRQAILKQIKKVKLKRSQPRRQGYLQHNLAS